MHPEETADGRCRQLRPNNLSQNTSTAWNFLNDKPSKRSTWGTILGKATHFLSPGDSRSRQKDQRRHTEASASRLGPRSSSTPYAEAKRESNELQEIRVRALDLENTVTKLTKDLQKAHEEVAVLTKAVTENEAIITRAHATAISTLADNVSRKITDDMIREELNKFLQTDVLSWCADLCTGRILDEDAALSKLLQVGIINNSESYLKSPEYLKFTVNTPDGSGPFLLLKAALVHRLCYLYLCDAYFLAEASHMNTNSRSNLYQLERNFGQSTYYACPLIKL